MAAKESIISKVQKLLNLAMDPAATEGERELAQKRADELMVRHMIEQADLKADDPNRSRVTNSVWKLKMDSEFAGALRQLLTDVTTHAQCRTAMQFKYDAEAGTNYKATVVGTPEAIAYAERLWFTVFSELTRNMFPTWDSSKSFDANVYAFVKGGFKWRQIHEIAWKAEGSESSNINDPYPPDPIYDWKKNYAGDGGRLKRAYAREAKRLDEMVSSHTSRHGAYRASYVQSFTATIRTRLYRMRKASKESVNDADRFALAVQSTKEQADAEFYLLFPEFSPAAQDARWAAQAVAEAARRAAMTQAQRDAEDARNARAQQRNQKYFNKMQDKRYDSGGWARGDKVAKGVNLNDDKAAGHKKAELS